ncbi:cytochrome oxidase subunit 2 (mitochondrion) [Eremothecium sinecaudum]|uniref:Cytochrome c oxidase subunit 2 n=2 Tax=Eremothecium sinecaudum TaxID=45286 RepID=A0A0X8HX19_9SACH|nr:cytochrome oxidase subunit 2 [Eremothecium sinecaudum]AMD23034.1 cytochrome oxidase subunit 2 [Eremothecium sinecaudum]
MFLYNLLMIMNDVPIPYGMYFQDSSTPNQEGIIELHDNIMFYLLIIFGMVSYMLYIIIHRSLNNKFAYKYMQHGQLIEIIWTTMPAVVLLVIAFPSFMLLYLCDEVISPAMTIKTIGLQWYWKYEYSDFINDNNETIELEAYVIPEDLLEDGQLRLLDTDNSVVVPVNTHIRFIVTAADVIHDFAVPSLGIKIDTTPGRLNQVSTLIQREGVFYGQCSELCGTMHSTMPIKIEAVSLNDFLVWLNDQ